MLHTADRPKPLFTSRLSTTHQTLSALLVGRYWLVKRWLPYLVEGFLPRPKPWASSLHHCELLYTEFVFLTNGCVLNVG